MIVSLYVDDLIFTGNDENMFVKFKNSIKPEFEMTGLGNSIKPEFEMTGLGNSIKPEFEMTGLGNSIKPEFEMTGLGKMKYFLGVKILQNPEVIYISQRKYAKEVNPICKRSQPYCSWG